MADAPVVPEKLRRWLEWAVQVGASDLHLIVGYPPVIRLNGDLTELAEPPIGEAEALPLFASISPPGVIERLHEQRNADFSFELEVAGRIGRFRGSLFHAGRQPGAC